MSLATLLATNSWLSFRRAAAEAEGAAAKAKAAAPKAKAAAEAAAHPTRHLSSKSERQSVDI